MISVTILTKNSEKMLEEVLAPLAPFDEVVVADTGSQDRTEQIAKSFKNVRFVTLPFSGFGPAHNQMAKLAKGDWVFSIDSDEVATDALVEEVLSLLLDPKKVYAVERKNYYRGKHIWSASWGRDWVKRLYYKKTTSFSEALVHEEILSEGLSVERLHGKLAHVPYHTVSDFLRKLESYSTLSAKGKKVETFFPCCTHGLFAFFRSYILKGGALQGKEGLEISLYNGLTAYYKYLKAYSKYLESKVE